MCDYLNKTSNVSMQTETYSITLAYDHANQYACLLPPLVSNCCGFPECFS